ncbi:cyclase [Amycolatopsis bartoniae]|uniref:MBL fold metallo-hydrolase n=1 Tax=Amycolatopsis bartoniae TaxID=941986 RepID=A0A8H9M8I4_9PSEU|nr:MBL fold metallo-hydrolase [Amycolatopsis bartoniae]MBB2939373.1 cyclase [Amycolatopsis bartoniae]TVT06704.1 MBL fold metallo-hydrolase [Amycolatopsis bartoniae]GHF83497.1 MBL fold metallo-hydrolase [Amycolatopsis bartoniae]
MNADHDVSGAELVRLTDRVWAWIQADGTWWVNNAGAVAGERGLCIVDTCATATRTRAFLAAVGDNVGTPIRWAFNTHAHGDHTYGNSLLPADTMLIGQRAMCDYLRTDPVIDGCPPLWEPVPNWGEVTRRVPEVEFTDDLTLDAGNLRVELRHPGYPAHTTGDGVAWIPDEGVLFTGDLLFNGLTPLVFMGSVDGALRSLEWLTGFGATQIVPGHGPVISGPDLDRVLADHEEYYRLIQALAAEGIQNGKEPLEVAVAADLGRFSGWADNERLVPNLHRAYADRGAGEVDVVTALADAVTWRGRPMRTVV